MADARESIDQQVLHRILSVGHHLSMSADLREILSLVIDVMRETLQAERATVFEYDAQRDELFSAVAHDIAEKLELPLGPDGVPEIRMPATAGLAGECAQRREIINVPDAYADDRFNRSVDQKTGFRTRSILAIPLVGYEGDLVGVAQVLNKRDGAFDEGDEQIARALAAQAAVAMKRGRLIEDRLMRQKLERDLELARRIQQSSFPQHLPRLPGIDIDAWSEPAEETGGDAYDVVGLWIDDEGRPVLTGEGEADQAMMLMADATGHGVGPALSVTQLRSMLRMGARLGADLTEIAGHINEQLCADLPPGRFVTAWMGVIDSATATLAGFSAGQAPLLLYRAGPDEAVELDADMPPLGVLMDPDADAIVPITLEPGDIFAVISDGIYEAMNPRDEQFGIERVVEVLRRHRDAPSSDIIAALRSAAETFSEGRPPDDDRTGIIIRALPRSAGADS